MAQAGLGHIYGTPFGVRGDRDKAEYWLQKAIDQETEAAQETRTPLRLPMDG
jgi:TPR repeat protein